MIDIQKDKKTIGLLILSIFLIQILFLINTFGLQDDSHLEVTLHAKLESNSSEIHSTLMGPGTYSFFETPTLNTGTFEHDLTTIDITNIQKPSYNKTETQTDSLVIGVNASVNNNHTIYFSNSLEEYECSNLFDTQIKININYSSDDTKKIEILNEDFTSNQWSLFEVPNNEIYMNILPSDDVLVLQSSSEIFHEDFTSNQWRLSGVSEEIMVISKVPTDDAHVYSYEPDTNFGTWSYLWLTMSGTYYRYGYLKREIPYLISNYTQNSVLKCSIDGDTNPSGNLHFYKTSDFDESTITWNNKPALGEYISTKSIALSSGYVYYEVDLGEPYAYYGIKGDNPSFFKLHASPTIVHYLSKIYQDTSSGNIYMQTNETETLSLKSPVYDKSYLFTGEKIVVQCKTTSTKQINLQLLNEDVVVKTIELIPNGNSNFGDQLIELTLDEDVIMDQMVFTGEFDDTKYFKCYDIKAERSPDVPYGSAPYLSIKSGYNTFLKYEIPYLFENATSNSILSAYFYSPFIDPYINSYHTSNFDESTLTWNNQPASGTFQATSHPFTSGRQEINLGDPYHYYKLVSDSGESWIYSTEYGDSSKYPYIMHYLSKKYQNFTNGYIYMQTDQTETLKLKSPVYDKRYLQPSDKIVIQFKTTSTKQVKLQLLNEGVVVKELEVVPNGNSNFGDQTIELTLDENKAMDQMILTGEFDDTKYFKCYDIKINQYSGQFFFSKAYIKDFNYTVLNQDYTETYELVLDDSDDYESTGNYTFYFDSTFFQNRTINQDVIIPTQNLTIILFLAHNRSVNFTTFIEYSFNTWKLPTETNLKVNRNDVIDETYNSGYISLENFPNLLEITADEEILFKLNISIIFVFKFELEVISKTYLKKNFELLSNHKINIERLDLPDTLEIKKIYINNIDLGDDNPNYINPIMSMDTNNIFNLEIILSEELYLSLNRIYNTIGYGTSNIYLSGNTNMLSYNNIDQFIELDLTIPNDHNPYSANLDFSDIKYTPAYESNETYDTYGNYEESQSYLDPTITYNNSAYTHNEWDIYGEETTPTNISMNEGTLYEDGSLSNIDGDCSHFGSNKLGIYNGTYSFEDDNVGSDPSGWTVVENSGTIDVIYESENHKKVVEIDDTGSSANHLSNSFSSRTSGVIEYWIRSDDTTYQSQFRIYDDPNYIIFMMDQDSFWFWNGSWTDLEVNSFDDIWYHIRAVFDCSSHSLQIDINGIDRGNYDLSSSLIEINKVRFTTDTTDQNYKFYIDAVDYNWTSGYSLNRNAEPLYSFEDYPATYSFTEDETFAEGNDISWIQQTDAEIRVIDYYAGHHKALMVDTLGYGVASYAHSYPFDQKINGTIEFYFMYESGENPYFRLRGQPDNQYRILIRAYPSYIRVYYGDSDYVNQPFSSEFPHVRIEFDCETDTFSVWVDGLSAVVNVPFQANRKLDYMDRCNFYIPNDSHFYFDAIGYSWDSNYTLGDNLHYNYFLGSETFESYNQTYEGNYFGSDSFDYYTEPEVYYGTYDFRDDSDGGNPSGWIISDETGGTINVVSDFQDHKKVIEMDNTGIGALHLEQTFTAESNGILEFWVALTDVSYGSAWYFITEEDGDNLVQLRFTDADLDYYNGTQYVSIKDDWMTANTWYHIKIIDDDSSNQFDLYIDGVLEGNDEDYRNPSTVGLDTVRLYMVDESFKAYIDAVGYSWDDSSHEGEGYNIGWNINSFDLYPLLNGTSDFIIGGSHLDYGNNINIEAEVNGHRNVLRLDQDTTAGNTYTRIRSYFDSSKISGTMEWWVSSDNVLTQTDMTIGILTFSLRSDEIMYYDSGWQHIDIAYDNTWYHFRVDFECSNGAYLGLGEDEYDLYINGTLLQDDQPFPFSSSSFSSFYFQTYQGVHESYFDAYGYSWDSEYNIGDNINSHGKEIISDLESNGLIVGDINLYTSIGISGEYNSHKKILNLTDNVGSDNILVYQEISQSSGTIEWYWKTTSTTKSQYVYIRDGDDSNCIRFMFADDGFFKYDDGTAKPIVSYNADQWYHIRIEFDCSSDWHLWINGTNMDGGTGYGYRGTPTLMDRIDFRTRNDHYSYSQYIDALSYSWDYDMNYNLKINNPIELSFTTYLNFNYTTFHNDTEATLKSFGIYYSYKTDIPINLEFYIWNYNISEWFLINSSVNSDYFYNLFYELNNSFYDSNYLISLKFYGYNNTNEFDLFIDKLLLELNYTILFTSPPLLTVSYKNPVIANELFNISINIQISYYNISEVRFWDSYTNSNQLLGYIEGTYNVSLSINSSIYYDICIFTNDTEGAWRTIEITNLFVCKRANYIEILNLKNAYYQNNTLNIDVELKDYLNVPISDQIINLLFTNQTNNILNNTNFITDNFGTFQYNLELNYCYLGFYHLNFTFKSNIYLNYSKLISFEVLPIERLVNTQQIDLKANNFSVANNSITLNNTNEFDITCLNETVFDLDITFTLTYNDTYSYNNVFDYNYKFEATSEILFITFIEANITDYPENFDLYSFNNVYNENYEIYQNSFSINSILGISYYNDNSFNLKFEKYQNSFNRTQLTQNPNTNVNEVVFKEYYKANRSYNYWYFYNNLEINECTLNQTRTNTLITDFQIENNKYYFEATTLELDNYDLTVNYNPNWFIDYEIIEKNQTYSNIKIDYKADLAIQNVNLIFEIKRSDCFESTLKGTQNDAILTIIIPNITFLNSLQSLNIEAYRTQLTETPSTKLDYIQYTESFYYNNETLLSNTIDIFPDFYLDYQILHINRTYSNIKIDYKADLAIQNINLIFEIKRNDCFESTLKGTQNNASLKIIIPGINFQNSIQSLNIEAYRTQLTKTPTTNLDYIQYTESFYCTDEILLSNTIDIIPNFFLDHQIIINNGTYSKVKVDYKADLSIENVSLILNLKNDSCYNDNWTKNAIQSPSDYKLTIPSINFLDSLNSFYIEGYSSIPYASISSYKSDQNLNRIAIDTIIEFAGFVHYNKYTHVFYLQKEKQWDAYNLYYGNETYSVESVNDELILISGEGFDPAINNSYLHFETKPFHYVDWQYENKIITITINNSMVVDNAYFIYQFNPSGVHTLNLLQSNITINDLSDSGDSEGYLSFRTPRVPKGITIIKIKVNFATPMEMLIQSIIIFVVCGTFIGLYYYLKNNEKALKKIKGFVDKKVLSKLKRTKEEKGLNEVVLEIKNNKIYLKKK